MSQGEKGRKKRASNTKRTPSLLFFGLPCPLVQVTVRLLGWIGGLDLDLKVLVLVDRVNGKLSLTTKPPIQTTSEREADYLLGFSNRPFSELQNWGLGFWLGFSNQYRAGNCRSVYRSWVFGWATWVPKTRLHHPILQSAGEWVGFPWRFLTHPLKCQERSVFLNFPPELPNFAAGIGGTPSGKARRRCPSGGEPTVAEAAAAGNLSGAAVSGGMGRGGEIGRGGGG